MSSYDVIVVGGGTAGCAAAYTAGRLGLKTLLIEKNSYLGGTITAALVIPAMKAGKNQINTEFFEALCTELRGLGGQITYQDNPGWFNPELTKDALNTLMKKAGVNVIFNAKVMKVDKNDRKILSVYTETIEEDLKKLSAPIVSRYIIDATGNCDVGKLSSCEFLDKPDERQPCSLRFIMDGVDVKAFGKWLLDYDSDREVTTVEIIDGVTHLSTSYTWDTGSEWALKPLFDDAVAKGILEDTDRNYFQVFSIAGMPSGIAFNCPREVGITDLEDEEAVQKLVSRLRESIKRIANFCVEYFPGFENAKVSKIVDELGVRVSHRIKGKYVYTYDDLKSGKKFENIVVAADYPVDIHGGEKDSSTLEHTGEYYLPLESLMSADFDNFFVAGRCLSADFKAQAALRVQPSCFSMGEGVAKYIAGII